MPSPFPGMDPYLEDERVWPLFQQRLVHGLHRVLLGLPDRYQVHIRQRRYTDESTAPRCEDYIDILHRGTGKRVTLLEIVSPTNKTTDAGRHAYLNTRREARAAGANLVEIDLVLQGRPMLDYSRNGLPEWDYAITVTRATQPDRHEIYTSILQKRLPRFRLPLAPDDRDTVLDLQAAFASAYDEGGFAQQIDRQREPPVPLSEKNRSWMIAFLGDQGEGESTRPPRDGVSQEEIARVAHALWLTEGCPEGRDQEHWFRAEEQLKRERRT
jgi:hypothetical protein